MTPSANTVTMDWTSVPDNAKLWTIPRERFKSDTEHLVPLSDDACAILVTLPRFAHGDYLFTFTDGEKPLHSLGSNTKEYLDHRMQLTLRAMARRLGDDRAQVKQIKLEGWVNHDLRRTVRTNLSELRIPAPRCGDMSRPWPKGTAAGLRPAHLSVGNTRSPDMLGHETE